MNPGTLAFRMHTTGCPEARRLPGIVYIFLQSHVTFHQIQNAFSNMLRKLDYNTKYRDPHRDLFLQCYISSNLLCFFSNTIQQCRDPHRDMKRREECEICGEIVWVRSSWSQLFCIFDFYLFSSTYKYIVGRSSQSGPADSSPTQLFCIFHFYFFSSTYKYIAGRSSQSGPADSSSTQLFLIFDFYFFLSTYKYKGHIHFRWIVSVRLRQIQETFT